MKSPFYRSVYLSLFCREKLYVRFILYVRTECGILFLFEISQALSTAGVFPGAEATEKTEKFFIKGQRKFCGKSVGICRRRGRYKREQERKWNIRVCGC